MICSRHFVKGKKARIMESSDPDWVPTLNLEPPEGDKPVLKEKQQQQQKAGSKPVEEVQTKQTNRRMNNYEVYALIEGRVKYRHLFRYSANRVKAWSSVQRSCSPVLNGFTVEHMEQKWTKLLRLYQRITGPRDSKLDYYPAEEWVHYSKMHDAMSRLKNPALRDPTEEEPEPEAATLHASSVDVDDYYITGEKILWGKGSENRPRPSRAAQLAYQPIAKRPVSLGNRTCKAIQSGNPGLQPTARPVPPPGSPDFCRLCFTNQQLEPLCSGVIVVRDELLEKIYVCTGVLIVARPKESVYVCRPCAALINNFSTFRQQICSNNRALLEQLKAQNPPEIAFFEAMPPLVGTTVSSVLSQAHVVRGPAPKKIILTPPSKNVLLKVRPSIPVMVRTPQPLQTIANPRLPTLTRAPNAPVIVKRIIYAKPSAVPVAIPPSQIRPTDEAAMDLPEEEIKTEFDDPLEGCGDSGNALVMPKPLKTTAPPPPSTTLKMRVESHPAEPALVSNAGAEDSSESWKCWNCEQNFPFKFECAKHLLQAHQESVASIRERLKLDELNTNMLEMMALRAVSGVGRKVVMIKAAAAPPVAKRPRVDDGSAVEVVELE
uniref:ZAD domain-containing protein n=1 Tax=Culex tarsalis TaxID=7177 RepID=A0A1Q3F2W1_CULTA